MVIYAVVDESLSPTSPLGDAIDTFVRREDAERFIARVKRVDPKNEARSRAVCSNWPASSGMSPINDALLLLEDRDWLAPGEVADVRIHPLSPEFWTEVAAGAMIAMHEGPRAVGGGEVLEVVEPPASD